MNIRNRTVEIKYICEEVHFFANYFLYSYPFGRICLVVQVVRKGGESRWKWSLAFTLYIGSFPCAQLSGPVHTARLGQLFFCVFSLGLCFVCSFVLFDLFVMSPILLCFPE